MKEEVLVEMLVFNSVVKGINTLGLERTLEIIETIKNEKLKEILRRTYQKLTKGGIK